MSGGEGGLVIEGEEKQRAETLLDGERGLSTVCCFPYFEQQGEP